MATSRRQDETIITEETVVETKNGRKVTTTKRTSNLPAAAVKPKTVGASSSGGSSKPAQRPYSMIDTKQDRPLSRLFGSRDKLAEPQPQAQKTTRPLSTNLSAAAVKPKTGSSKPAQRPYSMIDTKQPQLQVNRTTKQPSKTQSALPSKPSFLTSPFKKGDPQSVSPSGSGKAPRAPQEKPPKSSFDDFKREILTAHNEYRNKHPGTPLLVWSDDLTREAQQWVQRMADDDRMQHAPAPKRPGQGENLAGAWGEPMTGRKATDQWYEEIKNYNFSDPRQSRSPHGHFTQVVWKGSTQMGAAMATSGTGWNFIVARYRPAGNMRGAERMNVLPLE